MARKLILIVAFLNINGISNAQKIADLAADLRSRVIVTSDNSPRNLATSANWEGKVVKESKYSQHNVYSYTFTEQDYLDAK